MTNLHMRLSPPGFSALRDRQWPLALMLMSLHVWLVYGVVSNIYFAFALVHYGCFLIWQPLWRTRQQLSAKTTALFVFAGVLMIGVQSWWLAALWLSLLFALLGGRLFHQKDMPSRYGYLVAAGYLIAMLLLNVVPHLLHHAQPASLPTNPDNTFLHGFIEFGLVGLPLTILFTREAPVEEGRPPALDFFYTLLLFLLAVIVVMGCFVIEVSMNTNYAEVIMIVLLGCASGLVLISWLWNPRAGFTGIGQLLSSNLLSLGMPFERWMKSIAELANTQESSESFIQQAMQEAMRLPWVSAVIWDVAESSGELGQKTPHFYQDDVNQFRLTIYTQWSLTPAMMVHLKLLTQVLREFYVAKRREETLKQNVYMQAVYETGSRLTHDVKNLVQSLSALCGAAEQSTEQDNERLVALIRRQLPILNQRLSRTLEKLAAPRNEKTRMQKLASWWRDIRQHHAENQISFVSGDLPNTNIDPDLLDSVLDNLLQNAMEKRKLDREIDITVTLNTGRDYLLQVADSGKAMPETVANTLFKKQVSSNNGLGIGLYHAGQQALQAGFRLYLHENRNGLVCFRLSELPSADLPNAG